MSNLSKAERDKLSPSDFGDPARRLFPIMDADDVRSTGHLIGKAKDPDAVKKRIIAIAKRKGLSSAIPEAWKSDKKAKMARSPRFEVDFALDGADDAYEAGDYVVYPKRKLWQAGDYPSHDFSMTADELATVADTADTVPLDIDHKPTVIRDDRIGHVLNFTGDWEPVADDAGETGEEFVLRGDVSIHRHLDPVLKPETKLSTTWDRKTRTLVKTALLLDPAIPDAKLAAAFSAAGISKGAESMPKTTDKAGFIELLEEALAEFAEDDSVAGAETSPAPITRSATLAIQKVHNATADAGALCDPNKAYTETRSLFSYPHEVKNLQKMHDMSVKMGAECEGPGGHKSAYFTRKGTARMGAHNATETGESVEAETPALIEVRRQLAEMQSELERTRHEARSAKAAAFADRFVSAEKLRPGMRDLVAAFSDRLLADDEADPQTVAFSRDGKVKGTRLDGLATILDAVKPAGLAVERVTAGVHDPNGRVLFEDPVDKANDGESTAKRIAERARARAGLAQTNGGAK